jgi:hypothetical protein
MARSISGVFVPEPPGGSNYGAITAGHNHNLALSPRAQHLEVVGHGRVGRDPSQMVAVACTQWDTNRTGVGHIEQRRHIVRNRTILDLSAAAAVLMAFAGCEVAPTGLVLPTLLPSALPDPTSIPAGIYIGELSMSLIDP